MAMIKNRVNPINITPFVDVLLVLFVILVVIARFDGISKASEYINANKELRKKIKSLKNERALLAKLLKSEKEKNKTIDKKLQQSKKEAEAERLIKTTNQKLLQKLESLKKKNSLILNQKDTNKKLLQKISSLKKKNSRLMLNQKDTKKILKYEEAIKKLKTKLKDIKNILHNVKEELIAYKNDPRRKDDLYIFVDREGKIWLIDAITRKKVLNISFQNYKDILSSLTFARVRYFFLKNSKKSIQTIKKLKITMQN